MSPLIVHLSSAEIIALHDRTIALFGGLSGVPDPGRVEALIGRMQSFADSNAISGICTLAAMYCVSIARGHVFLDGNKRTAINAALLFGRRNGLHLAYTPDMVDTVVDVAQGKMTVGQLAEYFSKQPVARPKGIHPNVPQA
jgi:death-on-curing protein